MRMTEKNNNGPLTGKKSGPASLLLPFAITLGGVLFLPQMLLSEGRGLGFSNSFLSVAVFLLAFPAVRHAVERMLSETGAAGKVKGVLTLLLAFGFVLACTLGSRLEADGYLLLTDWRLWLSLPFLTLFFAALLERLYGLLEERMAGDGVKAAGGARAEEQEGAAVRKAGLFSRWENLPVGKRRLLVFLFFLIVWGIVLLAVWPGFFVYDAQEEFNQVAQRRFTTHHPLLHVLLLGGIISAGNKLFGSYNAGIACYMIFQMTVLAACFTWVVGLPQKKGRSPLASGGGNPLFCVFSGDSDVCALLRQGYPVFGGNAGGHPASGADGRGERSVLFDEKERGRACGRFVPHGADAP